MKKEDAFVVPVSSLSVKHQRNAMKQAVREHGDTDPLKLEERRIIISERMIVLNRQIENMQLHKKAMIAEHDRRIIEVSLRESKIDQDTIAKGHELAALEQSKAAQTFQYDTMISGMLSNQTIAEGLCLIVDGVTLREEVVAKSGKKGMMRFSCAGFMSDVDEASVRTYKRMRKLYDLQRVMALAQIPAIIDSLKTQREKTAPNSMERLNIECQIIELNKLSGQIVSGATDEDTDGGDDFEFKDEDIIDDDKKEEIKKKVHGE